MTIWKRCCAGSGSVCAWAIFCSIAGTENIRLEGRIGSTNRCGYEREKREGGGGGGGESEADLRIAAAVVPLMVVPRAAGGVGHEVEAVLVGLGGRGAEAGARAGLAVVRRGELGAPGAALAGEAEARHLVEAVD